MNNNLEFENEDPSPDSIEDNHPRTNYGEGYGGKETLEEAAKELYPIEYTGRMFMPNRDELNNSYKQEAFIEGVKSDAARDYWYAKWQQEQDKNKYSEEDMKQFAEWLIKVNFNYTSNTTDVFLIWKKQFKKK
jgi:hypothetical protein